MYRLNLNIDFRTKKWRELILIAIKWFIFHETQYLPFEQKRHYLRSKYWVDCFSTRWVYNNFVKPKINIWICSKYVEKLIKNIQTIWPYVSADIWLSWLSNHNEKLRGICFLSQKLKGRRMLLFSYIKNQMNNKCKFEVHFVSVARFTQKHWKYVVFYSKTAVVLLKIEYILYWWGKTWYFTKCHELFDFLQ